MHIIVKNGHPEKINGAFTDAEGVQHPRSVLKVWSAGELAAIGVYELRASKPNHDPLTENTTEGTPELVDGEWWQTWVISPASEEEIAERREAYKVSLQAAVDSHIETTAQSRDYNSAAHLAGYINSTVPPWKAEAETFIAWRDQVWLFVFEKLAQVEAGEIEAPSSPEALIGWLPQIEWPE